MEDAKKHKAWSTGDPTDVFLETVRMCLSYICQRRRWFVGGWRWLGVVEYWEWLQNGRFLDQVALVGYQRGNSVDEGLALWMKF